MCNRRDATGLPLGYSLATVIHYQGDAEPYNRRMVPLRPETKEILARVEAASGKPVEFMRDDSLVLLSTMHMARNGAAFHVLRYKPTNEPLDYFVAFQAGFVLRLFVNPPDRRFDFAPTKNGAPALTSLLESSTPMNAASRENLAPYVAMVVQWALLQLRSLPIGMRIDGWIASAYPGLRDLQEAGLAVQQQQNADILSRQFGALTVPSHLLATCAAYALYVDRLLGTERYAVPYTAAGVLDEGRALLHLWDEVPDDSTHDCELVDRWARQLGMVDWYRWIPYNP